MGWLMVVYEWFMGGLCGLWWSLDGPWSSMMTYDVFWVVYGGLWSMGGIWWSLGWSMMVYGGLWGGLWGGLRVGLWGGLWGSVVVYRVVYDDLWWSMG